MSGTPAEAPLHPWEWPGLPWSRLHVDYAGPYKGEMLLIVIDAYSIWLEVHCMKSKTSNATIEKLREIFGTHGLPATLVSDNGSNFTSSEFEEFMRRNGIKHIKVAPYHPASNGLAERAVRVLKEGFEKMGEGSIQTKISRFLLRYRTTPHSTTGVPPAELLMKRKLHTQLDRIFPSVADRVWSKQSKQKAVHDYHAKERTLEEGQAVHPKISGIRRHCYQVLWWKRQVQCQLESSWTMVQSFDDIKTMFVSAKVQLQRRQLPVRYPRQHP